MPQELVYRTRFVTDVSGARIAAQALDELGTRTDTTRRLLGVAGQESGRTGTALDALASRSGYARQAFIGMEMAARGDISAIFGVAQATRALIMSLTASMGVFTVIIAVLIAAAKAYDYFKRKQIEAMEAATKASVDAAAKIRPYINRLIELRDRQKEVTYSIKEQQDHLKRTVEYYDATSAAAKRYAEAQKKAAVASIELKLAKVGVKEAIESLAAKTPEARAAIQLKFEFERAEITKAAKEAEVELGRAEIGKEIELGEKRRYALTEQLAPAPDIARLKASIVGIGAQLKIIATIPRGEQTAGQIKRETELKEKLDAQIKTLASLTEGETERISEIKKRIVLQDESLGNQKEGLRLLDTASEVIKAEYAARRAQLALEKEIQDQHARTLGLRRAELEAQRAINESSKEESETIANLREDVAELTKQYKHQYKMATDPAYRKSYDQAVKDKEREEKAWEKQVARAERAQARGTRGRWITETLRAAETGRGAEAAKTALEQAEANMRINIERSANYLQTIKDLLDANLQMS